MKWSSTFVTLSAIISSTLAEDLLFLDTLIGREQGNAIDLGFTTKVVTEAQFRALTTADFASYKAIIFGDDFGASNLVNLQVIVDTKEVWGPAVTGNIIIHGADQSNHGKDVLISNSIKFAASGESLSGASNTGLYFALSQYYDTTTVANVDALSYFGTFEVRGDLSCYDKVHIVASSPAIDTLTDTYLSNWGCSVHEAFSAYPSLGISGFQAIAIADGVVFPGTQTYGDGHSGLPYIITRGATPAGCGDGKWDGAVGEECDDGNVVDGDGCSKSCKCESGLPKGDGTCFPSNTTIPVQPSGPLPSGSVKPSGYTNSSSTVIPGGPTTTPPYPVTTPPPPYVTPAVPTVSCIGVEIVVSVTVTELCLTIAPGTTLTSTVTTTLATYQQPIYNTQIASMPCYVCALSSQSIAYTAFITATSTYCPACSAPPAPATIYPCANCVGTTLTAVCPQATTPAFSNVAVYTSYSAMSEKPACTTCQYTPTVTPSTVYTTPAIKSPFCSSCGVTTSTYAGVQYTPTPSSTGPVQFTGAATKSTPSSIMARFAVLGAGLLGAAALVL